MKILSFNEILAAQDLVRHTEHVDELIVEIGRDVLPNYRALKDGSDYQLFAWGIFPTHETLFGAPIIQVDGGGLKFKYRSAAAIGKVM